MDSRAQVVKTVASIVNGKTLQLVLIVVEAHHVSAAVTRDRALRSTHTTPNIL